MAKANAEYSRNIPLLEYFWNKSPPITGKSHSYISPINGGLYNLLWIDLELVKMNGISLEYSTRRTHDWNILMNGICMEYPTPPIRRNRSGIFWTTCNVVEYSRQWNKNGGVTTRPILQVGGKPTVTAGPCRWNIPENGIKTVELPPDPFCRLGETYSYIGIFQQGCGPGW